MGTRVTLHQQNEQSYKDFVFVYQRGREERERGRRERGLHGNLIAVIQIHYKESMLTILSENGGALMCLCKSALFNSLQCGDNQNLKSK